MARTPVVDRLAAEGINYRRAYNQNTVCMPARSTMLTGQYVRTHGVVANGIPLPVDAPSVAQYLHDAAGYRTALLGKAHFEPGFDPQNQFEENARVARGDTGPWRGFERSEQAMHAAAWGNHPDRALRALAQAAPSRAPAQLRRAAAGRARRATRPRRRRRTTRSRGSGTTPTGWRTSRSTGSTRVGADEPWFCWMSFPDPHHPWDPPASELDRVPWQRPRPAARAPRLRRGDPRRAGSASRRTGSPTGTGSFSNMEGGPAAFVPSKLTHDQIREINAKVHVMNELIDEACGRVLQTVAQRGWLADTDVIFTTDHGEMQGDFGLLYKGPYHTDALMRLPFVWRPAPSAGIDPAVVHDPVGQVDLAPTFCAIAGVDPAPWMQGRALPHDRRRRRARAARCASGTASSPATACTCGRSTATGGCARSTSPPRPGQPNGLEEVWGDGVLQPCPVVYEQSATGPGGVAIATGELYNVDADPYQFDNLLGRPVPAGPARRAGGRPLRQPARRGAHPQGDGAGLIGVRAHRHAAGRRPLDGRPAAREPRGGRARRAWPPRRPEEPLGQEQVDHDGEVDDRAMILNTLTPLVSS